MQVHEVIRCTPTLLHKNAMSSVSKARDEAELSAVAS